MPAICKIMSQREWDSTLGVGKTYVPVIEADLRDGFIHCSTTEQLLTTLNRWYLDVDDVLVALIDEAGLTSELKWEPGKLSPDELFPHIYGSIVPEGVAGAHRLSRGPDGDFHLPAELVGA